MWKRHWRLAGDPFAEVGGPYVGTSGHDEAVARLVDAIEGGQRLAVLAAGAGNGEVDRAGAGGRRDEGGRTDGSRGSSRPADGPGLLAGLAAGLGVRVPSAAGRSAAWKALADAVKLCRWQKIHAVLVVDDCQELDDPAGLRDLERLTHLDPAPSALLTVVQSFREPDDDDGRQSDPAAAWQLAIRLPRLLRSETARTSNGSSRPPAGASRPSRPGHWRGSTTFRGASRAGSTGSAR